LAAVGQAARQLLSIINSEDNLDSAVSEILSRVLKSRP
jgi:hypothetical protein